MQTPNHDQEIKDKGRFDERHRFWTEQALNQFGVASNFFFLISLGFLAYLFSNKKINNLLLLDWNRAIDFSKVFYGISIAFVLISIISSSLTLLSRLHDLRLTRHTIWTRKRHYDRKHKLLTDKFIDLNNYKLVFQLKNFISTLRTENYFISDSDLTDEVMLNTKFESLRLRNLLLAKFSWWSIKAQITTLIISLLLYSVSAIL